MKAKMINTLEVRAKAVSAVLVAILTVMMVGMISVSAAINSVESGSMNKLIYGNSNYESNTINTDNQNCSFYSMPTYGDLKWKSEKENGEGPYCLDLSKEGLIWDSSVLYRNLYMYTRMANTTDSVYLGKTSGDKLYFIVRSRDGSDGAQFYLKKFRGEARY